MGSPANGTRRRGHDGHVVLLRVFDLRPGGLDLVKHRRSVVLSCPLAEPRVGPKPHPGNQEVPL